MESIAHGDYKSIENMRHLNASDIKPRLTDTIRDRKNFMIILNTICRKAAQSAYVHPVHLDEISRKFAIKIEACTSIAQLEALESDITRRYCMLVQSYSLRTYSKPVQNIINYISFNLTSFIRISYKLSEKKHKSEFLFRLVLFILNHFAIKQTSIQIPCTALPAVLSVSQSDFCLYRLQTPVRCTIYPLPA